MHKLIEERKNIKRRVSSSYLFKKYESHSLGAFDFQRQVTLQAQMILNVSFTVSFTSANKIFVEMRDEFGILYIYIYICTYISFCIEYTNYDALSGHHA